MLRPLLLLSILGLLALGCAEPPGEPVAAAPRVIETLATDTLNAALVSGAPTVDLGVYVPATEDERYTTRVPLHTLVRRIRYAQEIFARVGVQLHVLWIKRVAMPDTSWLTIPANAMRGTVGSDDVPTLYHKMQAQQSALTPEAERVLGGIIEPDPRNDRTVYLVGLRDVWMAFYEQDEAGAWELQTVPTNALSFPAYSLEDRIPRRLRGVITIQNAFIGDKVIAHELGHKLINVSHEYGAIDPQHEVDAEGGLMVYGTGTAIPSGAEGRWHRERLLRSPFVYRLDKTGRRVYNPDYEEHGHYFDPIYGDYVVGPWP